MPLDRDESGGFKFLQTAIASVAIDTESIQQSRAEPYTRVLLDAEQEPEHDPDGQCLARQIASTDQPPEWYWALPEFSLPAPFLVSLAFL